MHNKGCSERAGDYCAARRGDKQGRVFMALKKKTDKRINVHLKAQERGIEKRWGFVQKASATMKNEQAQNEGDKNEVA